MIGRKERGSPARKPTDPQRKRKAKRLLDSKKKELDSQEAQLLLKFLGVHPEIDTTLAIVEVLWSFLKFLKKSRLCIISEEEVFCFPLKKMVGLGKLGKAGGRNGE